MARVVADVPRQRCQLCGRSVVVMDAGRGFPPDVAARKLRRLCKADGCDSEPRYTAGYILTDYILTDDSPAPP